MYNHEPENYICPLCQIAKGQPTERGNQEEEVIFRDDTITGFIAGKWWRSNPGHVIIVPNKHIENIYDLPDNIGHAISDFSKKVAIALKQTYKCDGVSVRQHNEPAGNQDVCITICTFILAMKETTYISTTKILIGLLPQRRSLMQTS